MQLPEDFCTQMLNQLGEEEYEKFMKSMDNPCPVSIRWRKTSGFNAWNIKASIPWCPYGEYLDERPSFTLDPLFHAGAYYVQEASSMFIWHLCDWIKQNGEWDRSINALDLCAAPGGKSTLLLSVLPSGSTLIANEIMPKRALVLRENISKCARTPISVTDTTLTDESTSVSPLTKCIVTNNKSEDFCRIGEAIFDFILCDVPCSGEGMFRKDDEAIADWNLGNVAMCQERQRDIVSTIWDCLKDGGYMIYSTCTYNQKEDEDNVRWIAEELGAEIISVPISEEWNITPPPFYHFYPHRTKGEGFFCALLRKNGNSRNDSQLSKRLIDKYLKVLPLENEYEPPYIDVDSHTALQYLHGEALHLPADTPRGIVTITYNGLPLGQAKNIGNRANNLYPKEWRIRKAVN